MGDDRSLIHFDQALRLVVGAGVLLFIFAGQVLQFMGRIVTRGSFVLLAALATYIVYEVYAGWTAEEEPGRNVDAEPEDPVSSVETEYTEGSLSEAELESELDQLLDDQRERERRDVERDTEL